MIHWWLTARRAALALSLEQVASLTGISIGMLVRWAAGIAVPDDEETEQLATLLGDPDHPPGAWPLKEPAELGALAFLPGSVFGLGRVVNIEENTATIEHLLSPGHTKRIAVRLDRLVSAAASPQTRCYVQDGDLWHAGRVGQSLGDSVEVHFPDQNSEYLPSTSIAVRSAMPVPDPTDTLALKAHETAFFYRSRALFARAVLQQRTTASLAGLASAAVHLYPHQTGIIRRVLEDPVRRYLLADEVGLGKTIEAGAIIRQTLLDDSEARILVLVPTPLTSQWQKELDSKFDAFAQHGRVLVLPYDNLDQIDSGAFRLLVIDEAHHVARWAWESDGRFTDIAQIAHATPGLLLLSATPALHHEEEFLAMLHLLDPERYHLNDLPSFRTRVAQRVNIGKTLLGLSTSSSAVARKLSLRKVRQFFEDDQTLQQLTDDVDNAGDDDVRNEAITRLRDYISETHRIYRRLLRTRRKTAAGTLGIGRATTNRSIRAEYSLDERLTQIDIELGVWRGRALASFADSADALAYANALRVLVETAGTDLNLFISVVEARQKGGPAPRDLTSDDVAALLDPPLFDGEREALNALIIAAQSSVDESRADLLTMVLEGEAEQAVVFASYPGVAEDLSTRLTEHFGFDAVGLVIESAPELSADAVRQFHENPACRILVCDRSGEEGLNLQNAGLLVHYDLPFRPNRVEQRAGRLDRIGRISPMRTRVLLDPEPVGEHDTESVWQAWFEFLRSGFGVFEDSIADLQFFAERIMGDVLYALLKQGGLGLLALCADVRDRADDERSNLNAQDALDAVDTAAGLRSTDLDEDPDTFRRAIIPWVRDALQFKEVASEDGGVVYRHRRGRGQETLVPADIVLNRFLPAARRPVTFDRTKAVDSRRALPLRAGHPLFDALAAYADWDDRGRAFAVSRKAPAGSPYSGSLVAAFQFDIIVDAAPNKASGLDYAAVRRRADRLLPPSMATVFVDPEGGIVTDPHLLDILSRTYRGRKERGDDINLHKDRLGILDTIIPPREWEACCRAARDAAVQHLDDHPETVKHLAQARARAEKANGIIRRAVRVWTSDGSAVPEALDADLQAAQLVEAAIAAPRVRIDAAGFWVVQ